MVSFRKLIPISNVRGKTYVRFQSSYSNTDSQLPETVTMVPSVKDLTPREAFERDNQNSLVGHLQSRGLLELVSHDELYDLTKPKNDKKFKLYCGADPTAKSLHLGNLLPLMILLHFNLRGHDVFGIVGGATGTVGDPSGRSSERKKIQNEELLSNISKMQEQIITFLRRGVTYAHSRNVLLAEGEINTKNNNSWWGKVNFLDFLSKYGRHIRISSMLGRESIQSRLNSSTGLGFNEFCYQVLQAYDFWHLYRKYGVNIQVGGRDQWGNITAGVDLISRLQRHNVDGVDRQEICYGLSSQLLTTSSGEKFGKSAGNAMFIDETLTSPFELYQFFINTNDDLVERLLKIFTLLPLQLIEKIMRESQKDPGMRIPQRILAREVADLVHGVGTGDEMSYVTSFLFPTPEQPFNDEVSTDKLIYNLTRAGILQTFRFDDFKIDDLKMSTLLSKTMHKSKSEVKNLVKSGGIYLGIEREQFVDPEDVALFDRNNHLIDDRLLLIRLGKQQYYAVQFV